MIYADQRWIGKHGIGRFAREVLTGLQYRPLALSTHPAAPYDAWRLAQALSSATPNDLFFSPGYNTPLFSPTPFIFTIHDLSHVYCPENSSALIRFYYATILKRACHRARRILTVSEFTRSQILEWAGVIPEKVLNVGCGIGPAYFHGETEHGLPFPYFFSVSNRKLHKNEFRMIEAFAKAEIDPQIHLVLTGLRTPSLARLIERLNIAGRVDFLGVVPEERLPSMYRGAMASILVSLYEGFGLPVLEAMACGTPVITSNVTAMPEIAGDAALLVNPTDIEEISHAMERTVHDSSLRVHLREQGLVRAAQFSWEDTRTKVHQILNGF